MNIDFVIILKQEHLHLSPILCFSTWYNNSNKWKFVGVYHNINTYEQLTCAKYLNNSKDVNNFFNVHKEK
jgi:hypothetical protein